MENGKKIPVDAGLPSPGDSLTMNELAKIMRVSYGTVARAVRHGEIPAHKIGGARRILWGEFMAVSRCKPSWKR